MNFGGLEGIETPFCFYLHSFQLCRFSHFFRRFFAPNPVFTTLHPPIAVQRIENPLVRLAHRQVCAQSLVLAAARRFERQVRTGCDWIPTTKDWRFLRGFWRCNHAFSMLFSVHRTTLSAARALVDKSWIKHADQVINFDLFQCMVFTR